MTTQAIERTRERGALRNPQHERFARELVEQYLKVPPSRQPQLEAYKRAGYPPHRGNCHRLSRRPDVRRRVDELMDEARELLDIRMVKALVRVDRIADAKVSDFYEEATIEPVLGERRTVIRLKDITKLPPELAEAIAEVEYHDDGTVKKLKLHDKMQANVVLLKHFGGLPEENAPKAEVSIFNVLSPEDQRVVADALEALARRSAGAIEGTATPAERDGEAP
jgi:hypothetical protein